VALTLFCGSPPRVSGEHVGAGPSLVLGAAHPRVSGEHAPSPPGMIDATPGEILFIDNNVTNVEGARSAGLHAAHWHIEPGHQTLLELLAEHGINTHLARAT